MGANYKLEAKERKVKTRSLRTRLRHPTSVCATRLFTRTFRSFQDTIANKPRQYIRRHQFEAVTNRPM
jgi:hypothetical protein